MFALVTAPKYLFYAFFEKNKNLNLRGIKTFLTYRASGGTFLKTCASTTQKSNIHLNHQLFKTIAYAKKKHPQAFFLRITVVYFSDNYCSGQGNYW
ncbi:MAG: hypothetical protein N2747_10670 [Chitinophagaceae bacterium]|nr:hypothetical protein [Chitinophagaceae bacterium]